jgi:hypothetical protein
MPVTSKEAAVTVPSIGTRRWVSELEPSELKVITASVFPPSNFVMVSAETGSVMPMGMSIINATDTITRGRNWIGMCFIISTLGAMR